MEKVKNKILSSALGASVGLAGLASLSRCSGNACTSCMGCAAAGIWLLLAALFNKLKKGKSSDRVKKWI